MRTRPALNVLQLLTTTRWAIQREALERMVAIAERDVDGFLQAATEAQADRPALPSPTKALLAAPARAHPLSERLGVRDGVAILSITGPLTRYASWFTEVCGMTSYQQAAADFRIAMEDPAIGAVMLHLDSPGGETNGCAELAALVHAHRGVKPLVAMVSDGAASAAYWIAAACDEIVVSPSAYVGSIGCYWEIEDWSAAEAEIGLKRWRIVSSQSPNKVPDPADPAGAAVLQGEVDQFADAFIAAAAAYRGVSPQDLITAGNGGGIFIGRHAVDRGLADSVATTEEVLARLAATSLTSPAVRATRVAGASGATSMNKQLTARAGSPRAYAAGDEVRVLVAREISVAEGATGTVEDVREGATVLAVRTEAGDARWLLAGDEVELVNAAAGDPPPEPTGTDDADDADDDEVVARAVAAAVTAERARIAAIAALAPTAIAAVMRDALVGGLSEGDAAKAFLAANAAPGAQALAAMAAVEAVVEMPIAGAIPTADAAHGAPTVSLLQQYSPTQRRRALRPGAN